MDGYQIHGFPILSATVDDAIVASVDFQSIWPARKEHAQGIADSIGWVVDVTQEDVATPRKLLFQQIDQDTARNGSSGTAGPAGPSPTGRASQ